MIHGTSDGDFALKVLKNANRILSQILWTFRSENGWKDRNGGYIYVFDVDLNRVVLHSVIGEPIIEKMHKYITFSKEKASRLIFNLEKGHMTSLQSMDKDEEKFPGAILARNLIFSFSGLPADGDQLFMMLVAQSIHFPVKILTKEGSEKMIALSIKEKGFEHFESMYKKFFDVTGHSHNVLECYA